MRRLKGLIALAVVLAIASPAMAQFSNGNLFITVKDEQGAAIQGAKTVLAGADFSRTVMTDAQGMSRFISIVPGAYDLTVTMDGYNTMILRGIAIDIYATTEMPVTMQASQIVEEVVVTATTPLIDTRSLGTSTVYTKGEIEQVPQARDPWSVLTTIPGVVSDRVNVAGSEAGQQAQFVGKGDDGDQTVWMMDGVEFTDIAALGGSATYLDFNSFEQIGFATAGANFEYQSPGVQMEFVTKQGSNRVTGTARFLYADTELQDTNNEGLSQPSWVTSAPTIVGNSINEVFEKNIDVGGPVVKDNLWFWLGFTQNDINVQLITGQADITKLQNSSAKLHGQFLGKGTYKAFYTVGDKIKLGRGGGIDRPPETTWNQTGPSPIFGGNISYFFTPNLEATFQYSEVQGGFAFNPQGAFDQQILYQENGVYAPTTFSIYQTDRPQEQYLAKGNWFTSTGDWDHEIKFGFRYKDAQVNSFSKYSSYDMIANKYYETDYVYLYRELNTSVDMDYTNVWVGDTVIKGPWTFSLGLNWSKQEGKQVGTVASPNGLAPELIEGVAFAGFDPGFSWDHIAPRLGATYTFDWERRLLLRASYGQYVDQLGSGVVGYNIPLTYVGVRYDWDDDGDDIVEWNSPTDNELVDQNDDGVVDCLDAVSSFNINPCDTSSATSPFKIDPNLDPPVLDEFILGAEYELAKDFTLGVAYSWRQKKDFTWTPMYNNDVFQDSGNLQTLAGLDIYDCDNTTSGTAPDGTTWSEPYCELDPADPDNLPWAEGRARWETTNPDYKQEYNGFELTATKRLSNKWQMRAFLMYSEWKNAFDSSVPLEPGLYGSGAGTRAGDPTNFRGGTAEDGGLVAVQSLASGNKRDVWVGSSQWQFNVNGVYQLPLNWSVSGNLYGRQGYGLPYYDAVDTPYEGNKNVQAGNVDDERYDDLFLLDLRVAKMWSLGGNTNVEIAGEVFNVTNENVVLQQAQRLDSASTYQRVGEIVSPRILRIVATVNF